MRKNVEIIRQSFARASFSKKNRQGYFRVNKKQLRKLAVLFSIVLLLIRIFLIIANVSCKKRLKLLKTSLSVCPLVINALSKMSASLLYVAKVGCRTENPIHSYGILIYCYLRCRLHFVNLRIFPSLLFRFCFTRKNIFRNNNVKTHL